MAITWLRSRKTARAATPAAGIGQPRGRHARPALGALVTHDPGYDRTGWEGAERELLMPAAGSARPPWEAGEDTPAVPRGTGPEVPDLSEVTLTDKPLAILRPEAAPERPASAPAPGSDPARQRPYAPENSDGDAVLPVTVMQAFPMDGSGGAAMEVLAGWPLCGPGLRVNADGQQVAGLCAGTDGDVSVWIENPSVAWWDEFISQARRVREMQAYGGFRAPAVRPDPDAAEHREVLERELDDCMEQARGVLRATVDLGFLPAGVRGNGETIMDVIYARAALGRALDLGDEALAAKGAGELVDIISDLCGDEVACAIANGIVPSEEAVARDEEAPEPEAAGEPGEAADEVASSNDEGEAA